MRTPKQLFTKFKDSILNVSNWLNSITGAQVEFCYDAIGGFVLVNLVLSIPVFVFLGIWIDSSWFVTSGKAFVSLIVYMTCLLIIDNFIKFYKKQDE